MVLGRLQEDLLDQALGQISLQLKLDQQRLLRADLVETSTHLQVHQSQLRITTPMTDLKKVLR